MISAQHFFTLSPDPYCIVGMDGSIEAINPAFEKILGYDPVEVVGQPYIALVHPDEVPTTVQALEKFFGGITTRYQHRCRCKDGSYKSLEWIAQPVPSEGVVYAVGRDITAHKQAQSERSRFLAVGADLLAIGNFDGFFTWVSPSWEKTLGWTAVELTEHSWLHFVHPEDRDKTISAGQKLLAGSEVVSFENRYRCKDGSYRWISWRSQPYADEKLIYGVATDITERKRVESESENRFRIMADNAPAMLWVTDPKGYCTYLSTGWYNFTGQTEETGLGEGWFDAVHPEDRALVKSIFLEAVERLEPCNLEYRLRRKDGEERWVIDTASPWFGSDGEFQGYIGSVIDISKRKDAEAKAQEQQRLLRAVTNNAWVSLFIMDENQQCVFMNPAAELMTGFTLDEVWGRALHDIIHHTRPDGSPYPLEECPIDRAFPQNNQERGEEVFVHKNGSFYFVSYTASPIRYAGEIRGTVIEVRDITQEKEAERDLRESEARFRQLADAMPQIVWVTRADGYHEYYNKRWYEYLGLDFEETCGDLWANSLHPEDRERARLRWAVALETGEPYEIEYRFRRHDGEYRWFLGRALPVRDKSGKITRWYGTCTDIDEQKRMNQQREALLASEQEARSDAERASQLKDEFLLTLSHELRTPLNALLGWSTLLKRKDLDQTRIRQGLDVIERNVRIQSQLIDDLLDMSRIISGKLRLNVQQVELVSIIEAAVETVRLSAMAKGIRLKQVLDPSAGIVSGDPARLQQVVWNLLSNAIKFTPKGGRVQVVLERVDSHVEISVIDTGLGISPEFLPYVFDKFRQADASLTREHGGLGLGLAIVKHLVELHGGSVKVESAGLSKGATFIVELPLVVVHREQSENKDEPDLAEPGATVDDYWESALNGFKVLVVDDEPDARELIRCVLEDSKAQVITAGSAREALEILMREQPDVLVSDIGMPQEDGYKFIHKVRTLPFESGGKIPAVALTAYARADDRKRALMAGYQMHISKPVEPSELIAVVSSLVSLMQKKGNANP